VIALVWVLTWATPSVGVSAPDAPETDVVEGDVTQAAATHYAFAVKALEQERFADAINHLEAALAISPRPLVRYNLGQAYAAAGQPLKAYRTLTEYLAEDANQISPERAEFVRTLIRAQERKLAALRIVGLPTEATLKLDGTTTPATDEVWLLPGRHALSVTTPSGAIDMDLELAAGERRTLQLASGLAPAPEMGVLVPQCAVPGVTLVVDGTALGTTPMAPKATLAGSRLVKWKREGYHSSASVASVVADSAVTVSCELKPDPLSPSRNARLHLVNATPDTVVLIDGRRYKAEALAVGPHTVTVTRPGYVAWRNQLNVGRAEQKRVSVTLQPSAEILVERERQAEAQEFWSLVVGASGLGVTASAVGLFLNNQARYERWSTAQRDLDVRALAQKPSDHAEFARSQESNNRLGNVIGTVDQVTVGLGALGISALVVGAVLYLNADDWDSADYTLQADQTSASASWKTYW
jgi:tetratricopeptide (TPR) repeat protein